MPEIGTPGTMPPVRPVPYTSEEDRISGSIDIGIVISAAISSFQVRVSRFISIVRDAFVGSVTWTPPSTPPVMFHSTHESVLPNSRSPASARARAEAGDLLFGNTDSWVLWNMTGGVDGGVHVTDPTNASRTMLMNLDTLTWNEEIAAEMTIPMSMLPEIRSSSEVYGTGRTGGMVPGVPISGILGDQQAATFGQACFEVGNAKNTYGTGNFMLLNTGTTPIPSKNGLLTTVCYKIGDQPTVYALEGSIAVSGSLVQWLRDNLGMISAAPEIEQLAATVSDNGGAYFVPAFSGLFAPYWRADARGALVGLT